MLNDVKAALKIGYNGYCTKLVRSFVSEGRTHINRRRNWRAKDFIEQKPLGQTGAISKGD